MDNYRFCLDLSNLSYFSQRLHLLRSKCFQVEKKGKHDQKPLLTHHLCNSLKHGMKFVYVQFFGFFFFFFFFFLGTPAAFDAPSVGV